MFSMVSRKYTKALVDSIGFQNIKEAMNTLKTLSSCFNDEKFKYIISSPTIKKEKKESFIISLIDTEDKKIINFIKLLNCKNRLNEIPFIYNELQKYVNINNNEYELVIYSSFDIDTNDQEYIKNELSKRLGVSLYVTKKHMEMEGVRLFVDGISVETSFLKNGFSNSLKNYILKPF